MAFVGGSAVPLGHVNSLNYTLDIVAVPAIFADPKQTWGSPGSQWLSSLSSEIPGARTLLYDHLLPEERALEIKPMSHPDHQSSVVQYAAAHDRLQALGLAEWGTRLIHALQQQRNSPALRRRPIIFICHSIGGLVVKQALSSRLLDDSGDIAACCLWIAFLSTPHKGSSVLSDHGFAQTLRHKLGLKWEIGARLRSQLSVPSPFLEHLNDQFCSGSALGIQISSYVETEEMQLEVLTGSKGEDLTQIEVPVVDPQSAELATSNAPMDEDVFSMRADHVSIAALADDPTTRKAFVADMRSIVRSTNSLERAAHHELISHIMKDVSIDVHRFYKTGNWHNAAPSTRIWSGSTNLRNFLEIGPSKVSATRFGGTDGRENSYHKPLHLAPIFSQPARFQRGAPRITLEPAPTLNTPNEVRDSTESPEDAKRFLHQPRAQIDEVILHKPSIPSPSKQRHRFTWTHVPFSVTGWVEPVMKVIAKDKDNAELPNKLLMDQLWKSHHNRSRHTSHHSNFVRSYVKVLLPHVGDEPDELLSPSSAVDDLQFALFFPYLHWDTFRSLKKRNQIIKRRTAQDHVRPVASDVLRGASLEHKVIWQFLGSTMPVHCRRTLDGYGYPSLANTDARDMDQVMFKRTSGMQAVNMPRTKKSGQYFGSRLLSMRSSRNRPAPLQKVDKDAAYVLMVDELWLWILQDDAMVTFATAKEEEGDGAFDTHLQADLRTEVLKDVGGDFARQVDDCFDQAALMVFHATRALIEEADDPALNVFKTFEEHISEISELHTVAFKQFRDSHKIDDPKQLLGASHSLDYSADLDNLLELRDVEDELNTIKKLFIEQRKIVTDMLRQYGEEVNPRGKGIHGTVLLRESENILSGYEEQIESMIRSSQMAQNAFENLLDLKQKHSNIVEAHMTRFQTETASEQAKSVMIFTIVTIIFLPLSFFSSVFGMNVSDWSGTPSNPSLSYVLRVMGGISLAIVVVAFMAAFNSYWRRFVRRVVWKRMARPVGRLLLRTPVARLRKVGSNVSGAGDTGRRAGPKGGAKGGTAKREHTWDVEKGLARGPAPFAARPPTRSTRPSAELQPELGAPQRAPTDESELEELWKKAHAE